MKKSDKQKKLPRVYLNHGKLFVAHNGKRYSFTVQDIIPGFHAPGETPLKKFFRRHGITEAYASPSLYTFDFPIKDPSRYVIIALNRHTDPALFSNPAFNPLKRKDPYERKATFGKPRRPRSGCPTPAAPGSGPKISER